jgi:hypothetical protein|uniref:Uncharacterized protein n=1 Tax=Microchloropsis salina TaxID=2511165 RepID=A0A023PJZ3_9STRA|nr:hypothetical protein NskMp00202 [Microchloropsis salina]
MRGTDLIITFLLVWLVESICIFVLLQIYNPEMIGLLVELKNNEAEIAQICKALEKDTAVYTTETTLAQFVSYASILGAIHGFSTGLANLSIFQ